RLASSLIPPWRSRRMVSGSPPEPRRSGREIGGGEMSARQSPDLARITLQLLTLGALIATTFWIVKPFLIAFAWATMIAVATWPLFLDVESWLGGRRSLAVVAVTGALLLILIVPLYFAVATIVANAARFVRWSNTLSTLTIPHPPAWLEPIPLVGA